MNNRTSHRGFTLIELLVAMAVMLAATVAATQLMVSGVSLTRNAENLAEDLDNARLAGAALAKDIQAAGLFTPKGLYVYGGATAPTKINPIWARNGGASGSDELIIVVPNKNALRQACADPGAAVPIASVSAGAPTLNCPSTSSAFTNGDVVVVTNLQTGALLFGTTFTASGAKTALGATNLTSFSDTGPSGIGYQPTDLAYRAEVWRYFIKTDGAGRPGLYKHRQVPDASAAVFVDDTLLGDVLVQPYIEDLQVKFIEDPTHQGTPATYTAVDGYPAGYTGNVRAVRVTVVSVGRRSNVTINGDVGIAQGAPVTVEDHVPTGPADGYRRTRFAQELALPNLAPENL